MAITIDQASIGTPVGLGTSAATVAITTNVTVAANALIVLVVAVDPPTATISSASGGSLAWTVDKQGVQGTTTECIGIISAPAPAGLASGTTLTVTLNAASSSRMLGGASFLGADLTASRVDGTPPAKNDLGSTAWASGSYTIVAGSVIVAGAVIDIVTASAPTAPSIENWEVGEAVAGNGATMAYRIEAAAGSYTVAGTWTSGTNNTTIAVAYKAAVVPSGLVRPFNPVPFMSNGRL